MANVRAGVAYVDVRLGDVSKLKAELLASFAAMGKEIADKLGTELEKNAPKAQAARVGQTLGKTTSTEMSKAFFRDSSSSFGGALRAMATGQFRAAGRLFREGGAALGLGFRSGLETSMRGVRTAFMRGIEALPGLATRIASSTGRAFSTIGSAVTRASAQIDAFSKKLGFLAFQFQNLGLLGTVAFTAPVVAVAGLGAAIGINVASQIENATAALKFLLPKGYDLEALLNRLRKVAQESPVFDTADLIQFTQTFTAAGVEIGKTERFLKAFANVALVTGTDTQHAELAIRAITQAFGKGKLQAEELTQQLAEAMPSAMKIIRDQLGVTQAELVKMVSQGKITGDDLIAIFTKVGESKQFLEGAASGAQTLSGRWQELKETVTNQLGLIFLENADKIKQGIDELGPLISKLIEDSKPIFEDMVDGFVTLVRKIQELVTWYKNLSPSQQDFIKKLALVVIAAGPVIAILGTLGAAVAGIGAGIAAISNPVGLVIIAIVALVAAMVFLWKTSDTLREKVKALWDSFFQNIVVPFKGPLMDTWNDIKKAWSDFVKLFNDGSESSAQRMQYLKTIFVSAALVIGAVFAVVIGVLRGVVGAIGPIVAAILSFVGGIIKILTGLVNFIVGVFTGDWSKAWKGIQEIWDGLWDAIIGTLYNVGKAIVKFIEGLVKGIAGFFKWLYNLLVGNSIIPDMVNAIIRWFNTLVSRGMAIIRGLGNFFRSFYSAYIAPFVNGIRNGINLAVSAFTNLVSRIRSTLSSFGSSLYSAGRNIIQGLINGITSMAGAVASKAKSVVTGAIEAAQNALRLGSPSKVFIEIGRQTMAGLTIGIDRSSDDPRDAMMRATRGIIPAVSPDYGDRGRLPFDGSGPSSALNIENYWAKDDDPYKVAEDWYFLVQSRGATA